MRDAEFIIDMIMFRLSRPDCPSTLSTAATWCTVRIRKNVRSLLTLYLERAESDTNKIWAFGDPDAGNCGKNIVTVYVAAADAHRGDGQDDESDQRAFDVDPDLWWMLAFGSKKTNSLKV